MVATPDKDRPQEGLLMIFDRDSNCIDVRFEGMILTPSKLQSLGTVVGGFTRFVRDWNWNHGQANPAGTVD